MKRSLLVQFGAFITLLFVLAVSGMLSSLFIAETAQGYAAAINQAGTLRMQSYRITSSLAHGGDYDRLSDANRTSRLVAEYTQRLYSPRIQEVLAKGTSREVADTYRQVEGQWRQVILPNLENYMRHPPSPEQTSEEAAQTHHYLLLHLSRVDGFVEDIHRFVAALEMDAEQKNRQLRAIQLVLLGLTFALALVSLYFTKRKLLAPLQDLLACAQAARHGDFSVRSRFLGEDEPGQLGQAFNVMAEDLSVIYADLEARVAQKTRDLERSNRTLELLYTATKRLSDSSFSTETLEAVIRDIQSLLGADSGTICLGHPGDSHAYRYASTSRSDYLLPGGEDPNCTRCLGDGASHRFRIDPPQRGAAAQVFSTPIRDKQRQYGVMLIEFPLEKAPASWQERLLETVASHIALAINVAQQASEKRRLALLEERSVIARELHDSIAQSLSYLKIQVSRLDKAIHEERDQTELLLLSAVLRSALNGAYRQLRELLTTFRLRITEADLGAALKTTVDEFAERSGIAIEYDNRLGYCRPSPNAEIHVIQILREALSNIIRHADASLAKVGLSCNPEGTVELSVEDNGIGIDLQREKMQHYGLPIMKERADRLGGALCIAELPQGGTRITLRFNINQAEQPPNDNLAEQLNHA